MELPLVFAIFVFFAAISYAHYVGARDKLRDELSRQDIEMESAEYDFFRSRKHSIRVRFTGVARQSGDAVSGYADTTGWGRKTLDVHFDGDYDPLDRLRSLASDSPPAVHEVPDGLDLETRIRFETNQRLERIQGDREAFLAHDADGDGTVDAEEWNAVRERIAAEVRAEFSGESEPPTDDPPEEVAEEPLVAAVAPVETAATADVPVEDGHW